MAPLRRHDFFFFFFFFFFSSQKWVGEILGSKVPSRYIQHRINSRRGIAGLSCNEKLKSAQNEHKNESFYMYENVMRL